MPIVLSNSSGDFNAIWASSAVMVYGQQNAAVDDNIIYSLVSRSGGGSDGIDTSAALALAKYYCTFTRVGAVLTCDFYSDAARLNLVFQLTCACNQDTLRYCSVAVSRNAVADPNDHTTGYVEDLDMKGSGVNEDSEDLLGVFDVRHSASEDLAAEFNVRHDDSAELLGEFTVRQPASAELAGELVVRHDGSVELLGEFEIRRITSQELLSKFTVTHPDSVELLGEFLVRHPGSVDLLGEFEIRRSSSQELPAEFLVTLPASQDLPAGFTIRRIYIDGQKELGASFEIRLPFETLFCKFYVRPTGSSAGDFTIIDLRRGLTVTDTDRKMTVSAPRRRMKVK